MHDVHAAQRAQAMHSAAVTSLLTTPTPPTPTPVAPLTVPYYHHFYTTHYCMLCNATHEVHSFASDSQSDEAFFARVFSDCIVAPLFDPENGQSEASIPIVRTKSASARRHLTSVLVQPLSAVFFLCACRLTPAVVQAPINQIPMGYNVPAMQLLLRGHVDYYRCGRFQFLDTMPVASLKYPPKLISRPVYWWVESYCPNFVNSSNMLQYLTTAAGRT